jgi:hypothetical protein
VTVVNPRAVRAGAAVEGATQPAGGREAERNARPMIRRLHKQLGIPADVLLAA